MTLQWGKKNDVSPWHLHVGLEKKRVCPSGEKKYLIEMKSCWVKECSNVRLTPFSISVVTVCVLSGFRLCNPLDWSPSGSSVCGISQARLLEWVAIFFSRESSWPRDWTHVPGVSCLAGGFYTTSTTWEAHFPFLYLTIKVAYIWFLNPS